MWQYYYGVYVTLTEALTEFDSVIYEDHMPIAVCCGIPVLLDSQEGTPTLYCCTCGRAVAKGREGWAIADRGAKCKTSSA